MRKHWRWTTRRWAVFSGCHSFKICLWTCRVMICGCSGVMRKEHRYFKNCHINLVMHLHEDMCSTYYSTSVFGMNWFIVIILSMLQQCMQLVPCWWGHEQRRGYNMTVGKNSWLLMAAKVSQVRLSAMHRYFSIPTVPRADVLKALQDVRDNEPPASDRSQEAWRSWVECQHPLLVRVLVSLEC